MRDSINRLTEMFAKFPGVGLRQAKRFVYFLLFQEPSRVEELIKEIRQLKEQMKTCRDCYRFFAPAGENDLSGRCVSCLDGKRDRTILAVVASDIDLENLEKNSSFPGRYFVLGGNLSVLEKQPEKKVRLNELKSQVERLAKNGLQEIVLAMSFNPEGENTAETVKKTLMPQALKYRLKISSLGKGLSMGLELEYSDPETIKNALKNRS